MTAGVRIWSDLNSKKLMETEFIYWRHPSLPGIKVEEVSGGEDRQGNVWLEMARQIYCENGKDTYREIGHFHNGTPFLYGEQGRISVTHCRGLLAVATLPPTPEVELGVFSERTALGHRCGAGRPDAGAEGARQIPVGVRTADGGARRYRGKHNCLDIERGCPESRNGSIDRLAGGISAFCVCPGSGRLL